MMLMYTESLKSKLIVNLGGDIAELCQWFKSSVVQRNMKYDESSTLTYNISKTISDTPKRFLSVNSLISKC